MRQSHLYEAIKYCAKEYDNPVELSCEILHVSRSAYYKWLKGDFGKRVRENERIAEKIEEIHRKDPDKGYRRIRDDLERYHGIDVNDKRVLRICRKRGIKSTIKYANHGCTRQSHNPQHIAENVLNREFTAEKPNEKWLTDVTEFKWYEGINIHKMYLSAILDLYDRRIVSFMIGDHNDNPLVFDTFDAAVTEYIPRMRAVCGETQTALTKLMEISKDGSLSETEKEARICTEVIVPAVRTEMLGMSCTQHLVTVTLEKVEFCRSQLRVYLNFRNDSDFIFFFFDHWVELQQGDRRLEPDYIWSGFRPDDTVHSHTSSSGMLVFDVKDSQKDFRLTINDSYIGTDSECEGECFFEFDVEV